MRRRAGTVTRDLFDAEGAGFRDDAELLNPLVRKNLQRAAAFQTKAEQGGQGKRSCRAY
jgi:hypothetical protein